jgi:hypothetical protein
MDEIIGFTQTCDLESCVDCTRRARYAIEMESGTVFFVCEEHVGDYVPELAEEEGAHEH